MPVSFSSLLCFLLYTFLLPLPSTSSIYSFVYVGCSQEKFNPNTPYESNVNSALSSLVNSATSSNFNNYKVSVPGSSQDDIIYALYQCRGDVSGSSCRDCISRAVRQLGSTCDNSKSGGLQLEGCFIKYDSTPFLGVEDKTVVMKKCGPSIGYDESEVLTKLDNVMRDLSAGGQYFRLGGTGNLQAMTQCVQDMSMSECQDCLSEAVGQLKSECGSATWGGVFLGKCYARYSQHGESSRSVERRGRSWWWLLVGAGFIVFQTYFY